MVNVKYKFKFGDKVKVVRNSERVPYESMIGMVGIIYGFRCRDCFIEFSDGTKLGIIQDDLELDE